MPQSTRQKRKGKGEVMPPLHLLDIIDSLLREHLLIFPEKGELSPEEIEHWHRDLSPFQLPAIENAFECHRRNANRFPLYGQILDLCIAWEPSSQPKYAPGCSAECKARHRKGYGEMPFEGVHDITRLNELVRRRIANGAGPLSEQDIDGLLDELDKIRGSAPAWRKHV